MRPNEKKLNSKNVTFCPYFTINQNLKGVYSICKSFEFQNSTFSGENQVILSHYIGNKSEFEKVNFFQL